MTIQADAKGPAAVSVICRNCATPIKPKDMPTAEQARIDRKDGTWALQYDHGDRDCRKRYG